MLNSSSTESISSQRLILLVQLLPLLLLVVVPRPAASFSPSSLTHHPSLASPINRSPLSGSQNPSNVIARASMVSDTDSSLSLTSLAASDVSLSTSADPIAPALTKADVSLTSPTKGSNEKEADEWVPTTMREAFETFFVGSYNGPRTVIVTLLCLASWRLHLSPLDWSDVGIFSLLVVIWWLQEHVLHKYALHASVDWYGTAIHKEHHARPYAHVSIDPAPLMLGWLGCAALLLKLVLPLPLAISATLGYAMAGLFYEWAHYIVHTKVSFPRNSYWYQMKHHHIRHHMVDSDYWLGFSVPAVDDLFGTNPTLHQWKEERRRRSSKQHRVTRVPHASACESGSIVQLAGKVATICLRVPLRGAWSF